MNTDSTLRSIFQQAFDYRTYCDKIANGIFGCNNLKTTPELIETTNEGDRSHHMGSMEDADGRLLGFFYTRVADGADVRRRRVGLRKLIAPYLKYDVDAAIVVFDDGRRWRLSYICDLREGATAARRFSYVLSDEQGQYRTPIAQLQKLQGKHLTLSDLHEAFSVEALSKEFYNELFGWFEWAISTEGGVYFPNSTATADDDFEDIEKKIIRLITRLMFIWFIKQKDLVPARLFDAQFVGSVLKNFDPQSTDTGEYYNAILQNLFFATLNRAIRDEDGQPRAFARLQGQRDIKTLYRYEEMFSIGEQQVVELFAQIPFLNGGLFECLDKTKQIDGVEKAYNYDGFSRNDSRDKTTGRYKHRAMVPNRLFFDTERGLFAVLNRYNFTIEENAPNDLQVALDPEMLGKVFENLLGYYNPETRATARNQSGSFYTPRPIVNYMVDESLKAYLGNTPLVNEIFKDDFQPDELRWRDYQRIAGQLRSLTVFDPACGSGAFPMGLLNRIVELLQRIEPNSTSYELKLHLIEHCIYGSDIQSIAAQITKLRFFISLVCDCERDDSQENYGIPTLPNLETKFVTANTLVAKKRIKQGEQPPLVFNAEIEPTQKELALTRHKHFSAKSASAKSKLRKEDQRLREKQAKLLSDDNNFPPEDAKQMAAWNPYDQNAVAEFFDPEWMFGLTDGFDIVIGNPPYICTKDITDEDKKRYEKEFGFSDDTYNLFTFKGLSLCKKGGSLCFITPKTFWTTQTKRNMRDLLLSKQIDYVFDTANPFEAAMVDTCITQVTNQPMPQDHKIRFYDGTSNLLKPIQYEPINQSIYINTKNAVIFKPTELNLKIWNLYNEKVKELYDKWWDKIKTSRDIEKNKAELECYRASLKPGDIALLGCLTKGGQGLATANNGKYIAYRSSTKWAQNTIESRPKKLAEAIKKKKIVVPGLSEYANVKDFLASLSESEIAKLFDELKEKYGRDIFGKGYIYKIIDDKELADVEKLSKDEKENGIDTSKPYYVPYDKGDKDGNRWYLETPFAIAWSKENVQFLKTDPKARYQGYTFYFREGLCWSDINTTYLKCRKKERSIHDVKSMSIFGVTDAVPENYIITLINSTFISFYVDNFVNNTQTFQINDARQLPIIIPSLLDIDEAQRGVNDALLAIKEGQESELQTIQKHVNDFVKHLYLI